MEETEKISTEELQQTIESQMRKIQTQGMLIGAQSACSVILQKINTALKKPSKTSLRGYERLIKDIVVFCETGLSRKVNSDGTIIKQDEIIEEKNNV